MSIRSLAINLKFLSWVMMAQRLHEAELKDGVYDGYMRTWFMGTKFVNVEILPEFTKADAQFRFYGKLEMSRASQMI